MPKRQKRTIMPTIPQLNFPTIPYKKGTIKITKLKIRNKAKKQKKIKEHLKDIDFRTRQQRSNDWQKEINYWIEDLLKHQDSIYAQVQLPILGEIHDGLLNDSAGTIEWVKIIHGEATSTDETSNAIRMVCGSVLWLVDTPPTT